MNLGLKEMQRTRARFTFVTAALTFLVLLVLLLGALSDGLFYGATGAIRTARADAYVFDADDDGSLVRSRVPDSLAGELATRPGVEAATPVGLLLTSGTGPRGTLDLALFGLGAGGAGQPADVVAGRFPGPAERGVAAVDESLQDKGVGLGNTLTVGSTPIRVVGVVKDAKYQSQPTVWTSVPTWREARAQVRPETRGETGLVTAVALRLIPGTPASDVALPPGFTARSAEGTYLAIPGVEQQKSTLTIIRYAVLIVAGLVVALFFALLVLEKRELLAALKAVGVTTGRIAAGLLTQALLVAAVAVLIGAAVARPVGLVLPDSVPAQFRISSVVTTAVLVLAAAAVGVALSLRRVARIDPATALGGSAQ